MKINEVAAAAEDRDCWKGILRAANPFYKGKHCTTTTMRNVDVNFNPSIIQLPVA